MLLLFLVASVLFATVQVNQACTTQTTVNCATRGPNTRVIYVMGISPIGICTLVTIGSTSYLFDPIMINYVWITLINSNQACIPDIPAFGAPINSSLSNSYGLESIILNVTAQYYRMVMMPIGCTLTCQVNQIPSTLETQIATTGRTLYPLYNNLDVLGTYCLNGGSIDTSYTGAGYKCICPTTAVFIGPRCEFLERTINARQTFFNVFRSANTINIRFSFFSNGIIGFQNILSIKSSSFSNVVNVSIYESNINFITEITNSNQSVLIMDNQNWFDFSIVVTRQSATISINSLLTLSNPLYSTSTADFRSFYLILNEGVITQNQICIKNLILNTKIMDLNSPGYASCCRNRCPCISTATCNCRPFVSETSSNLCYCNFGYVGDGSYCTANNLAFSQMPGSTVSTIPYPNTTISSVNFGFRTLSINGTLLTMNLLNPNISIYVQIINTNLTLNIINQRLRTINYNVSNGVVHVVTLNITAYSIQMVLDNNLNYSTNLLNWFNTSTYISNNPITSNTLSLGQMQQPYVNLYNSLTTCFSAIQLNMESSNISISSAQGNPNLSPQCSSSPNCSVTNLTCKANEICMDSEWQNTKCICRPNFSSVNNSSCTYNLCLINPCGNGICYYNPSINNYGCTCSPGFTGTNCSIVATAGLWWIAILIVLLLLLIILIVLLLYFCCYRKRKPSDLKIFGITENYVNYNEQAGENDYEGPPINFKKMKDALDNKPAQKTPINHVPGLMAQKDECDNNNKDIILDHPLEYGYEGYNSDNGSISSIGSKSGGPEFDMSSRINDYINNE